MWTARKGEVEKQPCSFGEGNERNQKMKKMRAMMMLLLLMLVVMRQKMKREEEKSISVVVPVLDGTFLVQLDTSSEENPDENASFEK